MFNQYQLYPPPPEPPIEYSQLLYIEQLIGNTYGWGDDRVYGNLVSVNLGIKHATDETVSGSYEENSLLNLDFVEVMQLYCFLNKYEFIVLNKLKPQETSSAKSNSASTKYGKEDHPHELKVETNASVVPKVNTTA
ncbi:MAG: hypothetical protein EZS28_005951 [Streblomastix strix]|uniref:Uncharacterized protein n=1 Tax=Streblomastix strix TaxID=222440 RepID=A0A5J4WUP8_9EUKA|nr:MAG: hypothetical protein EZS28_005951 [Streblomastix strix]